MRIFALRVVYTVLKMGLKMETSAHLSFPMLIKKGILKEGKIAQFLSDFFVIKKRFHQIVVIF
jgi:hypothetical protein